MTASSPEFAQLEGDPANQKIPDVAGVEAEPLLHHTAHSEGEIRKKSHHQQKRQSVASSETSEPDMPGEAWVTWAFRQLSGLSGEGKPRWAVMLTFSVALQAAGHVAGAWAAGSIACALTQVKSNVNATDPAAQMLLPYCVLGLVAAGVKGAGSVGTAFSEQYTLGTLTNSLRRLVASRLIATGSQHAEVGLTAMLSVRLREFQDALKFGLLGRVRALAQLLPLSVALILVSPSLAIFGSLVLLPFAIALGRLRHHWRAASAHAQAQEEALHVGVDELVRNLDVWRTFGAAARIDALIANSGERSVRAQARVAATRAAISNGNEVLGTLLVVAALLLVTSSLLPTNTGAALAFVTIMLSAYRPLRDLGDAKSWLARGDAATRAISESVARGNLDRSGQHREQPPAQDWQHHQQLMVCSPALSNGSAPLEFTVGAGELVCLRGPTGCGKTTLLRDMLGLQTSSVELTYGQAEIAPTTRADERPFAWVPQDAPLVTGTILDNITLTGATEQAARQCLSEVGAQDLLESVGNDIIGPGGRALSGGERRLVSLARALAAGAPVLLLDEPTEGLDAQATGRVLDALTRMRGSRSMIVVTHRDEVAAIADRVVQCAARRGPAATQSSSSCGREGQPPQAELRTARETGDRCRIEL